MKGCRGVEVKLNIFSMYESILLKKLPHRLNVPHIDVLT
jgi:hypothetical protein